MGRWTLAVIALVGCSVEGARQAGDTCLNDRECAAPLRCELTPAGSQRCVQRARVDASLPDTPPLPDVVDAPEASDVQGLPDVSDAGD